LDITEKHSACSALNVYLNSSSISAAKSIIQDSLGVQPGFLWVGATIPVIARVCDMIEAEPLLVGFGMPGDSEHAENESFSLEQFERGFLYAAGLFTQADLLN